MADCCEDKACAIDQLQARQSGTLKVVLGINAVMFVVVLAVGLYAASTALLADSLDNLGDALTYAVSLYAVGRSVQTKGRVALFKGALILAAGLFVIGQVIFKILHPSVPVFEAMGLTGALALAANGTCLALLWKHRNDDVNMSSVGGLLALLFLRSAVRVFRNAIAAIQMGKLVPRPPQIPIRIVKGPR